MTARNHPNEALPGTLGEFYQRDHTRLDLLWAEFVSRRAEDADAGRDAFGIFRQGLERHMAWEDELLFAELARRVDDRGKLLTALLIWEHQGLRGWLGRLASNAGALGLEAELECIAFAGILSGHNRREEKVVYPLVDRLLGAEAAARVAVGMGLGGPGLTASNSDAGRASL